MKIGVVSLGCTKNLVDTEVMLGLLKNEGHEITPHHEEAEAIIVNTCSFIGPAKKEAVETILEMARMKETGACRFLIVTGCLAQECGRELFAEMPEIDALLGTGDFFKITQAVAALEDGSGNGPLSLLTADAFLYDHTSPRIRATWPHLAYIKIAEGCDNRCSYCLIPKLRGAYRSRRPESIVEEAKSLIAEGVREICLIAQDTTAFGHDRDDTIRIHDILRMLARVNTSTWFRLLYTYPSSVNRELIGVMAEYPSILPYLDIPLQHAHPRILQAMNRPSDIERIEAIIDTARAIIPDITLRTTFMVGFPGETDEEFESIVDFIQRVRFNHLGVFMYSREKGTPASKMSAQVPALIKKKRRNRLMEIQAGISQEKNQMLVGRRVPVIADFYDPRKRGSMVGRTKGQAPEIDGTTLFRGNDLMPGCIYSVEITEASVYDLAGVVV